MRIGDNLTRILASAKALADQFVKTELLRAGHFDRTVHRRTNRDTFDGRSDIVSRHRLNQD